MSFDNSERSAALSRSLWICGRASAPGIRTAILGEMPIACENQRSLASRSIAVGNSKSPFS
jgi:hypothetical protein